MLNHLSRFVVLVYHLVQRVCLSEILKLTMKVEGQVKVICQSSRLQEERMLSNWSVQPSARTV